MKDQDRVYYRMVDVSYLVGARDVEAFGRVLTKPADLSGVASQEPTFKVRRPQSTARNLEAIYV